MASMYDSIYNQNTTVRRTSMTTKSPRRSPNCRIYNPSSDPPKTRRLRHNTNFHNSRPSNKIPSLSIHHTLIMGHNHNQLNLLTPDRPKIINCLLISKPHSSSHHSHYNSNTMKLHRSYNTNNCPWSDIITSILPCKHQLRTNSQSNYNYSSRTTNNFSTNSNMMTISKLS